MAAYCLSVRSVNDTCTRISNEINGLQVSGVKRNDTKITNEINGLRVVSKCPPYGGNPTFDTRFPRGGCGPQISA